EATQRPFRIQLGVVVAARDHHQAALRGRRRAGRRLAVREDHPRDRDAEHERNARAAKHDHALILQELHPHRLSCCEAPAAPAYITQGGARRPVRGRSPALGEQSVTKRAHAPVRPACAAGRAPAPRERPMIIPRAKLIRGALAGGALTGRFLAGGAMAGAGLPALAYAGAEAGQFRPGTAAGGAHPWIGTPPGGPAPACSSSSAFTAPSARAIGARRWSQIGSGPGGRITMPALASNSSTSPDGDRPKSTPP